MTYFVTPSRLKRVPRERDPRWTARARRFKVDVGNWCRLCERRTWRLGPFVFWGETEVHHCWGYGLVCAPGDEMDHQLMVLCRKCHSKITREHFRQGRELGYLDSHNRLKVYPDKYAAVIYAVTKAAKPRYVARAVRRMFLDLPPNKEL